MHKTDITTNDNATTTIDADSLIKDLKARHPILAQLVTNEDKDLVVKFKDLDTKEAREDCISAEYATLIKQFREIDEPQSL